MNTFKKCFFTQIPYNLKMLYSFFGCLIMYFRIFLKFSQSEVVWKLHKTQHIYMPFPTWHYFVMYIIVLIVVCKLMNIFFADHEATYVSAGGGERAMWKEVEPELMSDEEQEDGSLLLKSPRWRERPLNELIAKQDKRLQEKGLLVGTSKKETGLPFVPTEKSLLKSIQLNVYIEPQNCPHTCRSTNEIFLKQWDPIVKLLNEQSSAEIHYIRTGSIC